jgi:RES domain
MKWIDTLKERLIDLLDGEPGRHPKPKIKETDTLTIKPLSKGSELFRLHPSNFAAKYFNSDPTWRFNNPIKGEYGVLYAALDCGGALRETLKPNKFNIISTEILETKRLSKLILTRDLRLVDLTGEGLSRIGADARLTTGSYKISQLWSQALYKHPDQVDGIFYCSRYDPKKSCVVLYENRVDKTDLEEILITTNNLLDESFRSELQNFFDLYKFDQ